PDFKLTEHYGPKGPSVLTRASGDVERDGVPGLFTLRGYQEGFNARVSELALTIGGEEAWVLGEAPKSVAQQATALRDRVDSSRLVAQVKQLYMDDYVRQWDRFIDDIQLRPITSISDSIRFSEILASRADSPLPILLRAIVHETTLMPEEKSAASDSVVQQAKDRVISRGKDLIRNRTSIDLATSS